MNNILVNNIVSNNKSYGKIYYDKETDQLYFLNKNGDTFSLLNRSRDIAFKHDDNIKKDCLHKGSWNANVNYEINDIVHFYNDLYICKKKGISISEPCKDHKKWIHLLNLKQDHSTPIIYSVYTNMSCCYSYDDNLHISIFNIKSCPMQHKNPEESNMYKFTEITIKEGLNFILPFSLITKNNVDYFQFDELDKSIHIITPGFYKMTYNISFHGSIHAVIGEVITTDDNDDAEGQANLYSISKVNNRPFNDINSDEFYNDPDDLEYVTQNIHHTFFLPIKQKYEDVSHKIEISLKFPKISDDKKIFIHPVETWFVIERIGNH